MSESNTKTPRTFQCRDALWKKFEEMAHELECSVDYLVNDAMKQYARQRGYAPAAVSQSHSLPPPPPAATTLPGSAPPPSPVAARPSPMAGAPLPPSPAPVPPSRSLAAPLPPPGRSHGAPPPAPSLGAPLSASGLLSGPPTLPHAPRVAAPLPGPLPPGFAPPRSHVPPPLPPPSSRAPAAALLQEDQPLINSSGQKLFIDSEGERFVVNKERFVIGRGKQSSDLTIRDPNVSRQHAVVEFAGGVFYMVDLGSTNGIEFAGQRVQRKAIQTGDVFKICDHELFMTLG